MLRELLADLQAQRLRTALTILGITGGKVAVVVLLAFGTGLEQKRRVLFLGNKIAERLFPDGDAVGKAVMLDGLPFVVIGVMAKSSGIPATTARRRIAPSSPHPHSKRSADRVLSTNCLFTHGISRSPQP